MRLSTIKTARQEFARIIKAYESGKILSGRFRDLCHGFTVLLQYHKSGATEEIEARLDRLEKKILGENYDGN